MIHEVVRIDREPEQAAIVRVEHFGVDRHHRVRGLHAVAHGPDAAALLRDQSAAVGQPDELRGHDERHAGPGVLDHEVRGDRGHRERGAGRHARQERREKEQSEEGTAKHEASGRVAGWTGP